MVKVLAFTARWCGPCRAAKPTLAFIGKSWDVSYYDADDLEHQLEFIAYDVASVPTFVVRGVEDVLYRTNSVKDLETWLNALHS